MNRKSQKFKKGSNHGFDETSDQYGYQGKPIGDNRPNIGLSVKSLRNQPKSSYSVIADPYTAALPGSEPYALLNRFNKPIGGEYWGLKNLDGGNVQQYSNSIKSKFLNVADFGKVNVGINYHYIPTKPIMQSEIFNGDYAGRALIDEQRRSISEATSVLQSTTFTQMSIYNYAIATDMPMGSAVPEQEKYNGTLNIYTNLNDVLYGALRFYQTFLQKILGIFNWHNSFRLKQGNMLRSAWNREVPVLNSFFGLMNKKSFLSLLNSIAKAFPGEYVDREFALQISKIGLVPSRRANALSEPFLELMAECNMPDNFVLLISDGEDYEKVLDIHDFNWVSTNETLTIDQYCHELMDLLSAEKTMSWARGQYQAATNNDNLRFNRIKMLFDAVQSAVTIFKTQINDVREVLDTVARTGLVTWYKGFRPSITKDTDAPLFRNLIVDDIIKMMMSGAQNISYDDKTKRWRTFSLWNMYDGIPEYDAYSGGAFLTFSLKRKAINDNADGTLGYLPVCLTIIPGATDIQLELVTRTGSDYIITTPSDGYIMSSYASLRRLVPLPSQDSEKIRVPILTAKGTSNQYLNEYSNLIRTVSQICGMTQAKLNDSDAGFITVDPDIFSIYQIEIEDITNEMVNYARINAPFRGATDESNKIGFMGTISGGSRTSKLDREI